MTKLNPCFMPDCREEAEIISNGDGHYVGCTKCQAKTGYSDIKEVVVTAWNDICDVPSDYWIRDDFARDALKGFISWQGLIEHRNQDLIAARAYELADEMMLARAKKRSDT